MTTTVTIQAHCAKTKEVHVIMKTKNGVMDAECAVLQDGEVLSKVVFDDRELTIMEKIKD